MQKLNLLGPNPKITVLALSVGVFAIHDGTVRIFGRSLLSEPVGCDSKVIEKMTLNKGLRELLRFARSRAFFKIETSDELTPQFHDSEKFPAHIGEGINVVNSVEREQNINRRGRKGNDVLGGLYIDHAVRRDIIEELIGVAIGENVNTYSHRSGCGPRETAQRPAPKVSNNLSGKKRIIRLLGHRGLHVGAVVISSGVEAAVHLASLPVGQFGSVLVDEKASQLVNGSENLFDPFRQNLCQKLSGVHDFSIIARQQRHVKQRLI